MELSTAPLVPLVPLAPVFLSYVLSFIYVGIYWNNHHHMLHATRKVSGAVHTHAATCARRCSRANRSSGFFADCLGVLALPGHFVSLE